MTVRDAEGRMVRTATSDTEGYYRLPELPPGTYRVIAERTGFAVLTRDDVLVRAGLNLELPLTMTLASQEQQVEVRGDPPM
jgi:Carboxypeptidase regulatory-like domain